MLSDLDLDVGWVFKLSEVFTAIAVSTLIYLLLKPLDWDRLRAQIGITIFILLMLIRYVTHASFFHLGSTYLVIEFIAIWIAVCVAVFCYFLLYQEGKWIATTRNAFYMFLGTYCIFLVFKYL